MRNITTPTFLCLTIAFLLVIGWKTSLYSQVAPHVQMSMNLASDADATHTAVNSGDWSNPNTWDNSVPAAGARVIIPTAITVTVDGVFTARLATIRVDGTLQFATNTNTELRVETIVTMPGSQFFIGTSDNPIATNSTAKILILDNGNINTSYDPTLLSRGIIGLGEIKWHGAEKTSFVKASQWFPAGTTGFSVEQVPVDWKAGDRVVLSGLQGKHQEEFTIQNINGTNITLDSPTSNDRRILATNPAFDGLYPYVANYSRNVIIESENKTDIHRRGHIMFMHQQEVDMRYVQLEELGRTNKAIELQSPVTSPTTNVVGRYALHFHRAGDTDPNGIYGYVQGCALWGSPGWGFVNHESFVWFDDNCSYNVLGSHFTDENGTELGGFRRNIAIYSEGSSPDAGDWVEKTRSNGDHGHAGVGFWATTGATVRWEGNVATDQNMSGYAIISRRAPNDIHEFDFANHDFPSQGGGIKLTNTKWVGINFFRNNVSYGGRNGIAIVDLELNGKFNTNNLFEDFTVLNPMGIYGLAITYMRNLHLKNVKILRDDAMPPAHQWSGEYAVKAHNTYDHLFKLEVKGWTLVDNVTVYGFLNGFELLRNGTYNELDDNKVYIDSDSQFFLTGGAISEVTDPDHFKINVDLDQVPDRPFYSVTPGTQGNTVDLQIHAEPGSTIYYTFGSGEAWTEASVIQGLDITNSMQYNGETITFTQDRNYIFAIAVKNDLYSRVSAAWYYLNEAPAVNVNVVLDGPYDPSTNLMSDDLRTLDLPITQPYSLPPYNYEGTETTTSSILSRSGNNAIVDWVLVELRDKDDSAVILHQKAGLLQRDGNVVDQTGAPLFITNAVPDDYYIAVRHRNHLGAMTLNQFSLSNTPTSINFSSVPTYGNQALLQIGNTRALWSGDASQDGFIDSGDRSAAWNLRNQTGYLNADINLDGSIDSGDRSIIWNHRNRLSQLP